MRHALLLALLLLPTVTLAAAPAQPSPGLPGAAGPGPRLTPLRLNPQPGTLLEYRVHSTSEVMALRPDVWSLDPELVDGVLAGALHEEGLLSGPMWEGLREVFSPPLPDAKFFVRVLAPQQPDTVRLALTYLRPDIAGVPGSRLEIRTEHTLRPDGTVLDGKLRWPSTGAEFLEELDAEMLWQVALGNAGFDPAGVFGGQASQVVQASGEVQLALDGVLTEGLGEGLLEGVGPVVSTVTTRPQQPTADGSVQRTFLQQISAQPWEATVLWTGEHGDPVSAPYALRRRDTEVLSRYRTDGLPEASQLTGLMRSTLGLPSSGEVPYQLVMHMTTRYTVQTDLMKVQ